MIHWTIPPMYVKEQDSGKPDYSLGVDRVVCISCLNQDFQALGGEFVFSDESPVDARDTCPTVYKGSGVDGFHCVERIDELNWDLYSR